MEIIGLSLTANVVSAFIGKQILSHAINDASGTIYGSIGSIFNYNSKIDMVIQRLDVKEKIKTVNILIKDIEEYTEAVSSCLTSIHDIIIHIKEDLKLIDARIKKHKTKYLARWRKITCSKELAGLETHSNILDGRLKFLLQALEIAKYNKELKKK